MKVNRKWLAHLLAVAAAVVAILAFVGGFLYATHTQPRNGPSATNGSVPSRSAKASSTATRGPPPNITRRIDPRWMGLETSPNWEEVGRRITGNFQQFGFRPVGESETPRDCDDCGSNPPTAYPTAYAPGKFDPTYAPKGTRVDVLGHDGLYRAAQDATVTWQYTENAWATVRGTTTLTSDIVRMIQLARTLRPAERTPVRVPLSLASVPARMPLAEIDINQSGTTLTFGECGMSVDGAVPDCMVDTDRLRVQILPADGYDGLIDDRAAVPWKIGGKDGRYDKASYRAAVQVQDGMLVLFRLRGPGSTKPTTHLEDVLDSVVWASDPGNHATWQPVTDWAK
jgi:hypothetical protein